MIRDRGANAMGRDPHRDVGEARREIAKRVAQGSGLRWRRRGDAAPGKRHCLIEVVPAGPRAAAEAEKVRTRLLHEIDERWNPKTRAAVNQLLDRYLETLDVEPTTRTRHTRGSSATSCGRRSEHGTTGCRVNGVQVIRHSSSLRA
jgi:hypothetical protein